MVAFSSKAKRAGVLYSLVGHRSIQGDKIVEAIAKFIPTATTPGLFFPQIKSDSIPPLRIDLC